MSDQPTNLVAAKPFAATLQEIANGRLAAQLGELLAELTSAVQETEKKGSLVLTISVAPIKKGQADTLIVSGTATLKAPKGEDPASVFFADASGNLRRDDPNQPALPLRGLDSRKAV